MVKYLFTLFVAYYCLTSCSTSYPYKQMTFLKAKAQENDSFLTSGYYYNSTDDLNFRALMFYKEKYVLMINSGVLSESAYNLTELNKRIDEEDWQKNKSWGTYRVIGDSLKVQYFGKAGFSKIFVFEETFFIENKEELKFLYRKVKNNSELNRMDTSVENEIYIFRGIEKKPDSLNWLMKYERR